MGCRGSLSLGRDLAIKGVILPSSVCERKPDLKALEASKRLSVGTGSMEFRGPGPHLSACVVSRVETLQPLEALLELQEQVAKILLGAQRSGKIRGLWRVEAGLLPRTLDL